jgi:hypothetical protein
LWLLRSHNIVYIVLCLATLYLVQNFIFFINIFNRKFKVFPFWGLSFFTTKTFIKYVIHKKTDTIQHLKPISDCQIYESCLNHTGTRHYIKIPCSQYKNRKHSILHLSASCSFSCFPIKENVYERTIQ